MTYQINIDQEFAIQYGLTLTQVSTLAAFATLPLWSKTITIDGCVWYQYSEEKMSQDFPLLFGCAKRCYKNISELCEQGFVELTKFGKMKFVRFTDKCQYWGRKKVQNRTISPETDFSQPETGQNTPQNSPKSGNPIITNNIINNSIINNTPADGGLFPSPEVKLRKEKRTSEALCTFENSRYNDYDLFAAEFPGEEFTGVDIAYYYHAVADWSARMGKKQKDWIATARNFMRNDKRDGKLQMIKTGVALSPDAIEYLKDMGEGL